MLVANEASIQLTKSTRNSLKNALLPQFAKGGSISVGRKWNSVDLSRLVGLPLGPVEGFRALRDEQGAVSSYDFHHAGQQFTIHFDNQNGFRVSFWDIAKVDPAFHGWFFNFPLQLALGPTNSKTAKSLL